MMINIPYSREFVLITSLITSSGSPSIAEEIKQDLIGTLSSDRHIIQVSDARNIANVELSELQIRPVNNSLEDYIELLYEDTLPIQFDIGSISGSPLSMRGFSKNVGSFLGDNQFEAILKYYNGLSGFDRTSSIYRLGINNITFPLIYPIILSYLPNSVTDIQEQNPKLHEMLVKYIPNYTQLETIVIVSNTVSGKHYLGIYKGGELRLGTYASPGRRGYSTPEGLFNSSFRSSRKRSIRYDNIPMPYAIQINGHIFIHGKRIDGTGRSHGCIGIPMLYAKQAFSLIGQDIPVVVDFGVKYQ